MSGNITDEMRAAMRQRVEDRGGTMYRIDVNEADAIDLAAGFVPAALRADFLAMLSWMDEDRRAAARVEADTGKRKRKIVLDSSVVEA